jgi:hypothetical protein
MTKIRLLIAGVVLMVSFTAQATLIGDTATCSTSGPVLTCSTPAAVVTPAPEFTLLLFGTTPEFAVDIGASSIAITLVSGGISMSATGSAFTLASLDDSAGDIVGIANFTTSGTTGIDASDITFTAHAVRFNVDDSAWTEGRNSFARFDLVVRGAAVAEPATLALLSIGLGAFGITRRRKTR